MVVPTHVFAQMEKLDSTDALLSKRLFMIWALL